MSLLPIVGTILPPVNHWAWGLCAAVAGAAGGRVLADVVGGLLDRGVFAFDAAADDEATGHAATEAAAASSLDPAPPPAGARASGDGGRSRRWIVIAAAAVAAGLWWWEVRSLGLHAGVPGHGADAGERAARWAAHAILFAFLAAATWIDLRHRVIPDGVTMPGVLLGLLAVWARPDVLLPVIGEEQRTFAPPLRVPDVLAWYGGLVSAAAPEWLGPAPHLAGLLVPLAIFLAWWSVCTAPWLDPAASADRAAGWWRRLEPRTVVLVAGVAGIVAAWRLGGERFVGLGSSLVGVAVAAGLVWSVREGASRALGREAMGLGDVTLMAMVGAWVGWQAAVVAFFLAAFLGLAHGVVQVVRHRESELPYGPSLCLASALVIVAWRWLWPLVEGAFADPLLLAVVLAAVVGLTAATLSVWRWLRG
jgi:leader peptidase (prepilin peptidase) / N-methyltransferase